MLVCRDLPALRTATATLRDAGRRLALVPTMGALHAGHIELVAAARRAADAVAASIFVNPLQFAATEDMSRYPRDEDGDLAKLRAAGCDLVWMPPVDAMYPPGAATVIDVAGPSAGWEGDARPGHFRGVATVCAKLFLQTGAAVAAFGEKDWQQLQVVTRMARDLDIPIRILPVQTVREADGLAMSSRNRFLTDAERATAPRLHAAMMRAAAEILAGASVAASVDTALSGLRGAGFAPDYMALVEAETLRPLDARRGDGPMRLLAAARLGSVRLLDNIAVG
ncbi:pantoate--beta-alanine ligase [Roseomonas sp. CECT 9278]|uniref:pantoate--beta-alanine ligase n=1 Tax=Roseomonas sp. CECT 9278 TaxID=2845823 RepID=UPI001E50B831|nr:pantoate--beta-alanine ligase [Roseomonas sp. CECT 9278]CAH0239113.1 Pantothenate synthetase [Roseomonas sp. CECT 9278]